MKKILLFLIALVASLGCSKESLQKSKWLGCLDDQYYYCMEFTSSKDVVMYPCDARGKFLQYDPYANNVVGTTQRDTYTKLSESLITFGGKLKIGLYSSEREMVIGNAAFPMIAPYEFATDVMTVTFSNSKHQKNIQFNKME